ncbi:hypothetical protein ACFQH6_06455 [Halobacteriaceae archaeon GCM10025711]
MEWWGVTVVDPAGRTPSRGVRRRAFGAAFGVLGALVGELAQRVLYAQPRRSSPIPDS